MLKNGTFYPKRASRKPYKAFLKFESRHTALFAIFALRGSGEPTEAFCLKIRPEIGSKMPKMAILTPLFSVFGQILLNFGHLNAPYYLLRGGALSSSSLNLAGSYGDYWSSTPTGSSYAYLLLFCSGIVDTLDVSRYNGYSVRCVAAG